MNTYQQELDALAAAGGPRQRFFTVFWLMMGIFPVVMAGTTPSVAVPAMRAWFHISHLEAQVVASVFLAGMTVGMLLSGGWIGSEGGRQKPVFSLSPWERAGVRARGRADESSTFVWPALLIAWPPATCPTYPT